MSKDLREFLKSAKEAGADFYLESQRTIKPELELNILQLKLEKMGRSPVIYCPEIEGSRLPLVSNVFGSYEMLGLELGLDPKTATKADVIHKYRDMHRETRPVKNVSASDSPVKEVILRDKDVDLNLLPITHHAPGDSGKYITIGHMICKDPDTGIPNVGVYRHEMKDKDQLGIMIVPSHHAGYIAARYAELKKPMEVAIFIGHHPSVAFSSFSRGDVDENELELMGGILGESLQVTQAETVDLPVPSHAEIVIEGVLDPMNTSTDGPLAEWEGYYGIELKCYLIKVTCITMRKDAIYHDLAPSQREHYLGGALSQTVAVYNAVKSVVPTVKEVYLPFSGHCNIIGYISISKVFQGEGKRALLAAINSLNAMRLAVVVDDDIDVFNEEEVLWAVATRTRADRDISIIPGVLGDPLCPTSYDETGGNRGQMISKVIIDATKPVSLPFPSRVAPPEDLWASIKLEDYFNL